MEPLDFQELLLRLGSAAGVGALLGLNREMTHKPAGMRTHALVALGTALVTVITIDWAMGAVPREDGAIMRVVQGILTGVGFIGGGVILKIPSDQTVHGITTASSIWIVAGLGIACGFGAWEAVVVTVVLALVILIGGSKLEALVHRARGQEEREGGFGPE